MLLKIAYLHCKHDVLCSIGHCLRFNVSHQVADLSVRYKHLLIIIVKRNLNFYSFMYTYFSCNVVVGRSWIVNERLVSTKNVKAKAIRSRIMVIKYPRENRALLTCH